LIDIFLWGPLFATFASFETCSGGGWFSNTSRRCVTDYNKGLGRLVVRFYIFYSIYLLLDRTLVVCLVCRLRFFSHSQSCFLHYCVRHIFNPPLAASFISWQPWWLGMTTGRFNKNAS
jgi:hypothetical protein